MAASDEGFKFPVPPEGLLKPRENSVIALLDEPDQAEAAVQDLVAQGFDRDGIYVLCTPVAGRAQGFPGCGVDHGGLNMVSHDLRRRCSPEPDRRRSQMESPIEVVRRFCAAWCDGMGADDLAAFFTDDAVYHNIPFAPVTGRKAIADNFATFIRPGPPGIENIEFRIVNLAADGPVVMTERVDVFKLPDKTFELPVMGTFEVSDGKIKAWRDYFDTNQFTSRMEG